MFGLRSPLGRDEQPGLTTRRKSRCGLPLRVAEFCQGYLVQFMSRSIFEAYGLVASVNVVTDQDTGRAKGFGFVEMTNDAEAAKAISGLNGKYVEGRTLIVNEARPGAVRPAGGYRRQRW
jgi:hypothetical protein